MAQSNNENQIEKSNLDNSNADSDNSNIEETLDKLEEMKYEEPVGRSGIVAHGTTLKQVKFICPVKGCPSLPWYQIRKGQTPPVCEIHREFLIKENDSTESDSSRNWINHDQR